MKTYDFKTKLLIGLSIGSMCFTCIGLFFTLFNIGGAVLTDSVGDWKFFFILSIFIGLLIFLITYSFKCVRDFWKGI